MNCLSGFELAAQEAEEVVVVHDTGTSSMFEEKVPPSTYTHAVQT